MNAVENTPKFELVIERMKQEFARNGFRQGGYLPTEISLAGRYRVNRLTIRKALKQLEQDGLVSAIVAKRRKVLAPVAAPGKATSPFIGCIGYGMPGKHQFLNIIYQQMFDQLVRTFQEKNMGVVPIFFDSEAPQLPELAHAEMMCGLLSLGEYRYPALTQWRKPLVGIDSGYDPLFRNSISPDGQAVAMDAVRYLAGHGHRQLALVHLENPEPYTFFDELAIGYRRAFKPCGLDAPPHIVPLTLENRATEEILTACLRRALGKCPDATALILCSSNIGGEIVNALRRLKIDAPRKLSLLSIGGDDAVAEHFSITSYANDYPAIATCARDHVLALLEGRAQTIGRVSVDSFRLIERGSVAQLRR